MVTFRLKKSNYAYMVLRQGLERTEDNQRDELLKELSKLMVGYSTTRL